MSYIFGAKIQNVYEILRASNYRICQSVFLRPVAKPVVNSDLYLKKKFQKLESID